MTTPRTARIRTVNHGTITLACPPWCLGVHEDDVYREDISHLGPDEPLTLPTRHGHVTHLTTSLEVRPFVNDPFLRRVFVNVEIDGDHYPTGLAGLEAMADALTAHADALRDRARQLAALLAGGDR